MPDNNYYILQKGDGFDWNEKPVLAENGKVLGFDSNFNPVMVDLTAGGGEMVFLNNQTLTQANWTEGFTYWEYEFSNINIGANSFVIVIVQNVSIDIAQAAELLPEVTTGTGTLTLYAKNEPTDDIIIDVLIGLSDADLTSVMTNPMNAEGDLITAISLGAPTRLAMGTANQFLRVNSGGTALEYSSFSPVSVIEDEGTPLTARTNLNFVGAGVTAEDDLMNSKTKVTINADVISIESSVTDNQIVRMNLASGKSIQTSLATIDDNGSINIPTGETYKINGTAHTHAITEQSHVIIADEVKVPSGDTDYVPPFFVFVPSGSLTLKSIRYRINSGTSVTFKLQKNGSDITNYTSLPCTTTAITTTQDESLANNDIIAVVVTAVSGTPKNMTVSFRFERTQ